MKPKEILQKKADKSRQRVSIPKWFTNKNGYYFEMQVYDNKIILISKKENKEKIWKENLN